MTSGARRRGIVGSLVVLFAAAHSSPDATIAAPSPRQGTTPGITLLYQNFPNPFPTPASSVTCLWFDLRVQSDVILAIYDLRGRLVRTIVPSSQVRVPLAAGSYGRQAPGTNAGCDARFTWDGRGSDGRTVPEGVYLARLFADGRWQTRKVVFRGV